MHQFHIADFLARESLRRREKQPVVYALTLVCETDMINLFQIAAQNVARLLQRFEDAKKASKDGGTLLEGLAQCVYNTGGISINMRPCALSDLIARRRYQNICEWAMEQSALCSRPVLDVLRKNSGSITREGSTSMIPSRMGERSATACSTLEAQAQIGMGSSAQF